MDALSRLGSCLLFSFIILQGTQQCLSHLIVNIEVGGSNAVKTGIGDYTIKAYNYDSNVIIKCSSRDTFPSKLSLWKGNKNITEVIALANEITFEKYYNADTVNNIVGNYRCAIDASAWISNDSYLEYSVRSEAEIRTNANVLICASTIGSSGYVGEKVVFKCTSFYYDDHCHWDGWTTNVLQHVVEEPVSEMRCTCSFSPRRVKSYNLPMITVFQSLNLKISYTVNITQPEKPVMEFFCNSTPPRLMYWSVFGARGNLLDLDHLNQSMCFNTTVRITQSPGETSLSIWEAVPGGNGIHTVKCYTYDTDDRVVAFLRIHSQSETSPGYESSSLNSTFEKVATNENLTTTVEGSTQVKGSIEGEIFLEDFEVNPKGQAEEMNAACPRDYFLIGAIVLPLLCIILILLGIVFYMFFKRQNKKEVNIEVSAQCTTPEIELHDNPAYLAFTETTGSTITSKKEEEECTYYNL